MEAEHIIRQYQAGNSILQIAKEYNTYPNKIARLLKKHGIQMRDKSEAQKNALEKGIHKHPTKGTKRTEETKLKISEKMARVWDNLSDTEKARRSAISKELWNNMTEGEKEKLRNAAFEAIRNAAKHGSKLEKFVLTGLWEAGYQAQFHVENLIQNEKMQIDLYVPELSTAIEIDGPSHFEPIWGEENLQKHIASDNQKNGLLLASGYSVIRVKHNRNNPSQKYQRDILNQILNALDQIDILKPKIIEVSQDDR